VFSQKGFSNINRWLDKLHVMIKKLKVSSPDKEMCKECGKPVEEHTIKQAKNCKIIKQE
jgi:hypothetical protein